MTWTTTPLHTFTCGKCGTTVTAIASLGGVAKIMRAHAEVCSPVTEPTKLEVGLAAGYRAGDSSDRSRIARLCDNHLDTSGALLGRVRDLASEERS